MADDHKIDPSWMHFVGIGGAGMSGLARIFAVRGSRVSGSDAKDSVLLLALRQLGCDVHVGHDPTLLGDPTCVVTSSAIRANNAELRAARERSIPVVHRAEALAYLMRDRTAVTVSGTHGKTSTTTMLAVAFQSLGLDPSYAIGADINEPGSNAHHGSGEIFVAEADESDRSFLHYRPNAAIVLNIEEDHHDHYGSLAEIIDCFEKFTHRIVPGGLLVLGVDDAGARELGQRLRRSNPDFRILTYGESDQADVHILKTEPDGLASETRVRARGEELTLRLRVPGRQYAHNAVGALAAGIGLGLPAEDMARALGNYVGVRRRFQIKGGARGVTVVDSYAHHPTEMAADLITARQVAGAGRVVAVFQPHLFSRTRALGEEMGRVLSSADIAVVMDIYAAREDPVPGITSGIVARSALENGALVRQVRSWSAVPEVVARLVRAGDLVLTMGAGDVTMLGPEILAKIDETAATVPSPR